ncbi:hypothetical protein SDC9_204944 [bioreactor metagenome]|uniref:Uncharacterized protein n=1 Tax=bioreactor metagenome TaxID=1076179 RepID=A0A645J252_9ZZZZ
MAAVVWESSAVWNDRVDVDGGEVIVDVGKRVVGHQPYRKDIEGQRGEYYPADKREVELEHRHLEAHRLHLAHAYCLHGADAVFDEVIVGEAVAVRCYDSGND